MLTQLTNKAAFKWPSFFKAMPECMSGNAQSLSPCNHCERHAFVSDDHIGSFISSLLHWCGPMTILWRIRTVIVDAIQLMVRRWAQAHVGKEMIEQTPSITHRDTTGSVVWIARRMGIQASGFHGTPDVILWCLCAAMSKAVAFSKMAAAFQILTRCFSVQAATRLNVAVPQITQANGCAIPTGTTASDQAFPTRCASDYSFNSKTSSSQSNQISVGCAFHWS